MNVLTRLTAPASRRIGQLAAIGGVALVLTAAVASPADARPRESMVAANMAIDYCFVQGGTPDAYIIGSTTYVSCAWEDGSVDTLAFRD